MSRDQRFPELEMQRLFDDAVERFLAGEPFDLIIEDAPAVLQTELAVRLGVVQQTQRVRAIPVPPPRRSEQNRAAFLAQATALRNGAQPLPIAASEPVAASPATPRPAPQRRPFGDLIDALFGGMRGGLQTLPGSAVALVMLLIAAMGLTTTVKAAADDAVPGETAFAVQEWIWRQELMLSPPERVQEVEIAQEAARTEAIQAAAVQADLNNIIIEETAVVPLRAALSGYYDVGSMIVSPIYQPDPNVEIFENMEIVGDLAPGAHVELTYRILPGQTGSQGKPLVQGVRMRVLAPPPPTPVPTPQSVQAPPPTLTPTADAPMIIVTPADEPGSFEFVTPETVVTDSASSTTGGVQPLATLTPAPPSTQPVQPPACLPTQPPGWTSYTVRNSDTLASLAGGDLSIAEQIVATNCLPLNKVIAGTTIAVPLPRVSPPTATPVVPLLPPTASPVATQQPGRFVTVTPTMPSSITPLPLPTDDGITTNPTAGPTTAPGGGTITPLTPIGTPPASITPPGQTPSATQLPTGVPTALPTSIATSTGLPTGLPPTLTPVTTAVGTPGMTPVGTPVPTTLPTALPTGPVILPPTGEATAVLPPTVTPGMTAEPTQLPPTTLPPATVLPTEAATIAAPTLTATPVVPPPGPNATATDLPPPPVEPAATSPPIGATATAPAPVTPTDVPPIFPPDLSTTPTPIPPPVATNTQPPVPPTVPAATARPTLPPVPLSTNTPVAPPTALPTLPPPTALPTLPPPPTLRPTLPPPPPTLPPTLPPPPTVRPTLPPPPTNVAAASTDHAPNATTAADRGGRFTVDVSLIEPGVDVWTPGRDHSYATEGSRPHASSSMNARQSVFNLTTIH